MLPARKKARRNLSVSFAKMTIGVVIVIGLLLRRRDLKKQKNELRLCFSCLKTGHSSKTCRSRRTCFYCKKNHRSALCSMKNPHG